MSEKDGNIIIFGGNGEIGGNKILIEDKKERIFLDFGQSFKHLDDYFVQFSYLFPRGRFGLKDYFEFDLMPKLEGLYGAEHLKYTELEFKPPEYDAVFVSHAHYDHTAHLRFLNPQIPIHMGEATSKIVRSTEKISSKGFSAIVPPGSPVHTFRSGKKINIGNISVTPIHVDHSVPGSYGFIVETSNGTIAYSGDLRQHGPRADMTEDFIKAAEGVDTLIIEGTRVGPKDENPRRYYSEQEVFDKSLEVAKECNGALITSRYPKDLDRFRTLYEIAKKSGKMLVISIKTAHLLLALKDDPHIRLPNPLNDEHIRIYGREKKIYYDWEKELISKCVNSRFVSRRMNELIFEIDFYTLPELIDLQPKQGDFIHSMSEPFQEDPLSMLSDKVLNNWLEHFHLKNHQLHASGHCSMKEIFGIIERIKPGKVIPIHTEHPELFRK